LLPCSGTGEYTAGVTILLPPAAPRGAQRLHFDLPRYCRCLLRCSITGEDKAGVTTLLPPAAPRGAQQLHFVQYGGELQLNKLQLEGWAGSPGGGGGGVLINRSRDGTDDNQPATFVARMVTFKSASQ
jgi:hypothetical protein